MSQKKVSFATPKPAPKSIEEWVTDNRPEDNAEIRGVQRSEKPSEPIKRLTIDMPQSLHSRIKVHCAIKGMRMNEVIREILDREFPKL